MTLRGSAGWPRVVPLMRAGPELAAFVRAGGVLAVPTESSYGLAVDPRSARGVEAIFCLKERERDKPLPVVVADLEAAERLGVDVGAPIVRWAQRFWPAPLTVLAPVRAPLPAMAGADRLAIRVPGHEGLRSLLARLGVALTATSANRSGEPPLTAPNELAERFRGAELWIVDGGALPGGPPSTVVSWCITPDGGAPTIYRDGRFRLPANELARTDSRVERATSES